MSVVPYCLVNISTKLLANNFLSRYLLLDLLNIHCRRFFLYNDLFTISNRRQRIRDLHKSGRIELDCKAENEYTKFVFMFYLCSSIANGWFWILRQVLEVFVAFTIDAKLLAVFVHLWLIRKAKDWCCRSTRLSRL